jgi:hypothetical protein
MDLLEKLECYKEIFDISNPMLTLIERVIAMLHLKLRQEFVKAKPFVEYKFVKNTINEVFSNYKRDLKHHTHSTLKELLRSSPSDSLERERWHLDTNDLNNLMEETE